MWRVVWLAVAPRIAPDPISILCYELFPQAIYPASLSPILLARNSVQLFRMVVSNLFRRGEEVERMMKRLMLKLTLAALIALTVFGARLIPSQSIVHAASVTTYTGSIDGASYVIEVPADWNGTLVLYSHGYVAPGSSNPARDAGDATTGAWLLGQGYALAGSSYSATGWAIQQALGDQIALLDYFDQHIGHPTRTIAWGHSLGGMITAGLVQLYPDRFTGALPMCGVVGGGIGTWNTALDSAFAFRLLLAGTSSPLQVAHITSPGANLTLAQQALATAQASPQGRARLALVAALADLPGWFSATSPEPASDDYAAQEFNQFLWMRNVVFPFAFAFRAELEARAGGNPSWNTGVNYSRQLDRSINANEVASLYQQAGLSLDQDLETLGNAPRIAADAGAEAYLSQYITYDGQLDMPVLTMHTTGDGLVINQDERAYASIVHTTGDTPLLQQVFVHRAGHCTFTPAETVTAFQTLIQRLDTGRWGGSTDPVLLNQEAASLGGSLNIAPPAFLDYSPTPFPRPFDARDLS